MTGETIRGTFELHFHFGRFVMAKVTGTYTIHVNPAQVSAPVLTPASGALPDETVGAAVSDKVADITGGTPPYSLSDAQGLPPGVTAVIGTDGTSVVLSGTPTAAGDASVSITVNDSQP